MAEVAGIFREGREGREAVDGFADGGRESPHAQPEALLLTDSINAPWVCGCGWVYLWLVVRAINI
jgi:hypothetical protein